MDGDKESKKGRERERDREGKTAGSCTLLNIWVVPCASPVSTLLELVPRFSVQVAYGHWSSDVFVCRVSSLVCLRVCACACTCVCACVCEFV